LSPATAQLKTLIKPRQQNPLPAYWELGKEANAILHQSGWQQGTEPPIVQLADRIGVRRTTLQESIKFAKRATHDQATRLQKHGIPWRAVLMWINLEPRHRDELYRKMISGLRNSTAIREFIAENFKKTARPRVDPDLAGMSQKSRAKAAELVAMLAAFGEMCERPGKPDSVTDGRIVRQELRRLEKVLDKTGELIRLTRARIGRR